MKKHRIPKSSLAALLLLAALPQASRAANYYWDTNGATAGFGSAGGTWGTDTNWSTDDSGSISPTVISPTTSDNLNFGIGATGLGAGTVAVTGTQNAATITFGTGSGAIVLSGGTEINLAAVSNITLNNAADTISTPLTGAATGLSVNGIGTLTLNGANTYTGTTTVGGGTLQIGDGTNGSLNGTTGTALTFTGTSVFNVREAGNSAQGMGALTFSGGQGTILSTASSGAATPTLTFASIAARASGATGNFNILTNTTAGQNKIVLTSTSNAPVSNAGSNNPGLFFGLNTAFSTTTSTGSTSTSFARYDTTNGYFRATNYSSDNNATTSTASLTSATDLAITATYAPAASKSVNTIRLQDTTTNTRINVGASNTLSVNGILIVVPGGGVANQVGTGTVGQGFLQPTSDGGEIVLAMSPTSALSNSSLQVGSVVQDFAGGTQPTKVTFTGGGINVVQASNTYTGVTTINSGLVRALVWGDAGSVSGFGKGSNGTTPMAADIVINGGILNYGNTTTALRTNRLFTIGQGGATLDNSGNSVGAANWTIGLTSGNVSSGSIAFSNPNAPTTLTLANAVPTAGFFGTGTLAAALGDPGTGANVTSVIKTGNGTWQLAGPNTYSGNTTILTGGTLTLTAAGSPALGSLTFYPKANDVCNKITGGGTANLNGTFKIDLSGASLVDGNSWTLVDAGTRNYNLTAVQDGSGNAFTANTPVAGSWQLVSVTPGGTNTWTFSQTTGVLSLQVVGAVTYAVTYNANSASSGTAPTDASSPYTAGATVTVLANTGTLARTGYTFTGWNTATNGSGTHYDATGSVTFTMPAGNVNLHAEWSASVTYDTNSASSGTAPTDATAYTQNQSATAASNSGTLARTGYTFGGWNTAANGSGTSYAPGSGSIAMNSGNVTLYPKWTSTVTYLANSATSGTVPTDNTDYTQNQSATAANNTGSLAQTGYTFSGWNTAADGSGTTYAAGSGNIPMSGGNVTLYAKWTASNFTLTYTAGANGSISGTSPQSVASGGNGSAVTAVPATGYSFVNWSDASTSNPRQDLAVSGNITVTANFAINTYTLTYTAGANGSITGNTPQTVNYNTSGTAVTAVPATGYSFVNWSDSSTTNPRTDSSVTANVSVTANFAIDTFTLTYTAGANGSITGTTPQTVNYNTSGSAVTAVPASGYHFINWSDASTANPRTDSSVTANVSVTANFAVNSIAYTVWASTYAAGGLPGGDANNDGVQNGVAYFMNATGVATNPALETTTRTVTWTNGGNIPSSEYGTQFVVQTSNDLETWTDVLLSDVTHLTNTSGSVSYTFTGNDPHFVRLTVTPNPN